MKKQIGETGYWNPLVAHYYHVHSKSLSNWIAEFLKNQKDVQIIDFGCGLGNYLLDLQNNGFTKLVGFEGKKPLKAVFNNIIEQDLTTINSHNFQGNVISLEVGEHIPVEFESVFINNIANAVLENKFLILSWAVVGQPGFGHVNCIDNIDLIPKIEEKGFKYLNHESESARNVVEDSVEWYRDTILIFQKLSTQ